MKKELSDDYEISVINMLDIEEGIEGFKVKNAEFYVLKKPLEPKRNKKILFRDIENHCEQIFHMNDGIFILEVENYFEGTTEYYYSENINDLI